MECQIHTLVAQIVEIHTPVRHNGEAQTGCVIELGNGGPFGAAAQQPCFADTGNLIEIPELFQKFCIHALRSFFWVLRAAPEAGVRPAAGRHGFRFLNYLS